MEFPRNPRHLTDDFEVELASMLLGEDTGAPPISAAASSVDGVAAGLINCFQGFSTFKCKPLINVHDVFVHPEHRRAGLVQAMMAEVEKVAKERGACKLTLEVLYNNAPAKGSYAKFGFKNYELDPAQGHAEFCERTF